MLFAAADDATQTVSGTKTSPSAPTASVRMDGSAQTEAGVADIHQVRQALAEELSARESELQRRERALGEQLTLLDQERRTLRMSEQSFQEIIQDREVELRSKEADVSLRLSRCEDLIAELEDEQTRLDDERAGLQAQRQDIQAAILTDLATERQTLDAEREALHAERKGLRRMIAQHERELDSAKDELRLGWETERETLRKQLTARLAAEVSADRQALDAERGAWERQRSDDCAALDDERAAYLKTTEKAKAEQDRQRHEQDMEFARRRRELEDDVAIKVRAAEAGLRAAQVDWENERATVSAELTDRRAALDREQMEQAESLARQRMELSQTLAQQTAENERQRCEALRQIADEATARTNAFVAEQTEWAALRDAEQAELQSDQTALQTDRDELQTLHATLTAAQAELETAQARQHAEMAAAHAAGQQALALEIAAARAAFEEEQSALQAAFEQAQTVARLAFDEERAAAENRLHFQSEHLERTREELEQARHELERRLQEGRTQAASLAEEHRLRQGQLGKFRELLDAREQALEREYELLAAARTELDEQRKREQTRRRTAEESVASERQAEAVAQKQARDDLAARAEQVGARQARLDTLRLELETTHRENLELRVALDETWVRLTTAVGAEKVRQELPAVRVQVAEYFRVKETEFDRRRHQAADDVATARKQLDLLDARRRELSEWLAAGLASLSRREEEFKAWVATLEGRENRTQTQLTRWQGEKTEAQTVIRGLLKQLADNVEREPVAGESVTAPVPSAAAAAASVAESVPKILPVPHIRLSAEAERGRPERAAG